MCKRVVASWAGRKSREVGLERQNSRDERVSEADERPPEGLQWLSADDRRLRPAMSAVRPAICGRKHAKCVRKHTAAVRRHTVRGLGRAIAVRKQAKCRSRTAICPRKQAICPNSHANRRHTTGLARNEDLALVTASPSISSACHCPGGVPCADAPPRPTPGVGTSVGVVRSRSGYTQPAGSTRSGSGR